LLPPKILVTIGPDRSPVLLSDVRNALVLVPVLCASPKAVEVVEPTIDQRIAFGVGNRIDNVVTGAADVSGVHHSGKR
jgi:hypothetical protein